MKELKDRLSEVMEEKKVTAFRLEKDKVARQATVGRWLRGVSTPYENTIQPVADYLGVNAKWLLTGESRKYNIVNESPVSYTNKSGNEFTELPNGKFMIKVNHIPHKSYTSFLEVYGDGYDVNKEFESNYYIVDKLGKGKYLSFSTKNDSMNNGGINDTPCDADLLAIELSRHHWTKFNKSEYGFIIISHDGIFHKDIEEIDNEGNVLCTSRNKSPEFTNFKINLNNVHSIYKVIKRDF